MAVIIDKPWTLVSPKLLCPSPAPTCVRGKLSAPLAGPPHSPLGALTAAVVPSYCDAFKILSFAQTVSCPVSSSELQSLDIRDFEARVQQFLCQPRLDGAAAPLCSLILPRRIQCNNAFGLFIPLDGGFNLIMCLWY